MSVWGQTTEKATFNENEISNNTLTFSGNHVTFTFSGGSNPLNYKDKNVLSLKQEENGTSDINYTLTIKANDGCSAKITAASVWGYGMHAGTGRNSEMQWTEGSSVNVSAMSGKEVSINNVSSQQLTLSCRRLPTTSIFPTTNVNFFIEKIKVTYTITPNAPALTTSSKTITVMETLDVADCFTVPDNDFSKAYECNTSTGKLDGSVFSATKAGTYYVSSYITAKDNCHTESARSTALEIIVNRIAGNIITQNTSTFVNDNINLSNCITSASGTGAITYQITSENNADATITEGVFTAKKAGTYTIKATKAQDDQYYEASTTFNITVNKKDQTLEWTISDENYEKNIVMGTTVSAAAKATSSSGLPVTYSSNNPTVASVNEEGDVRGEAVSNDDVTITVTQEGNDEYNPASSISRDFHVISKREISFTTSWTGTSPTLRVGDTATISIKDEGDGFTWESSHTDLVGISKEGNVITLTALKVGESTITLSQPETTTHSAVTTSYNVTVEKVPNSLVISISSLELQVDGTASVTFEDQNNTDKEIVGEITEQVLATEIHDGENVITYQDGVITACNAGTAKITFIQEGTDKYEGYKSTTYDITVTKIPNPITLTLNESSATFITLKYGVTATLSYTSENQDTECVVSKKSGSYTTLNNGTITAGNAAGTDVYAVQQAETYKYEEGYAQFSVRVNNTDEAEMYIVNKPDEHSEWTLTTLASYSLEGHPGDILIFEAKRASSNNHFYAEYSLDHGETWTTQWYEIKSSGNWQEFRVPLPEGVTDIRFQLYTGSTLNKYVRNVKVTRKTYLRATSDKTALGTVYTGETSQVTFTVDYSTTNGGNIRVNSSNPHFVVVGENPLTVSDNSDGTKTFLVTYTPDPSALGEESAVITISDLFYPQELTLTATAAKRENTLTVIGDQDLKVDEEVSDVYSNKNSDADITYIPSIEGIVTFDPAQNKLTAIGAGETVLTLMQAANDRYMETSVSLKVTVSKHDQELSWDNDLSNEALILKPGDHLSSKATASSKLPVTYSSANVDVIAVNEETGELTAKTGGSNIAITATQKGNHKYNEASITRYFTVISKIDATVITTLTTDGTNTLTIGEEPLTIGCSATITESNFTISGNEDGYIETSFADNTLSITPVKVGGSVTITLARDEDEGYNAIKQSYTLTVQGPVLTLDPESAPEVHFPETDYREVKLQRTLKAGYSTIALPFDTSIDNIVGEGKTTEDFVAQLSVVTYNAQDGYSLYFSKVTDGKIIANQPYILHLSKEVENPIFTNVKITDITPAEHTPTGEGNVSGWKMIANYTPHCKMEGKYGVVNAENCLKMGGENSSIHAFTAYIEYSGSRSAQTRTHFVSPEEMTEILKTVKEDGQTAIYDLQGRKLNKMGNGIHIIRKKDGTTRKVMR